MTKATYLLYNYTDRKCVPNVKVQDIVKVQFNKRERNHHRMRKVRFMKKKISKVVALGLSAILALTPVWNVSYATDGEEETTTWDDVVSDETATDSSESEPETDSDTAVDDSESEETLKGESVGVADSITGDLAVTTFFNEKTDAVELRDGDTYTFKFTNKSAGTNNWENFIMAITGAAGEYYTGSSEEILIIRADNWGWGGGMSNFSTPDSMSYNECWLNFKTDIDWTA